MPKKVQQGDVICDTGALPLLNSRVDTVTFGTLYMLAGSYQRLSVKDSHEVLLKILQSYGVTYYTNKDVVALNEEGDNECDIQVIFSQDNMTIGVLTMRR
jgi:hypothetical protein